MTILKYHTVTGIKGKQTLMYETNKGFFLVNNGAFGANDGGLTEVNATRAHTIIKWSKL